MTRLRRFERIAFRLALMLTLAAAARFGWVLTRHGFNQTTVERPRESAARPTGLPALAELQRQLSGPMASPSSIDSAIAEAVGAAKGTAPPPATAAPREYVKSYLSVQAGPARSEVRVDGLLVGHSPYVGQIGCERGKTVKIDLLPPKGMPRHYQIPCLDGEMNLRDEP